MWGLVPPAAFKAVRASKRRLVGSIPIRSRQLSTMHALHLGLKMLVVALLVAAWINPAVKVESRVRCRFYLIDRSESITAFDAVPGAVSGDEVLRMVNHDIRKLHPGDYAAVAVFGRNTSFLVLPRPAGEIGVLDRFTAEIDPSSTRLAPALEACAAHLPEGTAGEIVLFTDGRFSDRPEEITAALHQTGMRVRLVPVGLAEPRDARLVSLDFPPEVHPGDLITVTVGVTSTVFAKAVCSVADRKQEVALVPGTVRILEFPQLRVDRDHIPVRIEIPGDVCPQNNQTLISIPVVREKPPVLLLSQAGDATADQLGGSFDVDLAHSFRPPEEYAAVILENFPADRLNPWEMRRLKRYVTDLGGGLLVIGGPAAYGGEWAGTPLEEISPLYAVPKEEATIVFVLDDSGSMDAEVQTPAGVRRKKTELLKEAVRRALGVLRKEDRVAVVRIGSRNEVLLQPKARGEGVEIDRALDQLRAQGGTVFWEPLDLAESILEESEGRRALILITDGKTREKISRIQSKWAKLAARDIRLVRIMTAAGDPLSELEAGKVIVLKNMTELAGQLQILLKQSRDLYLENVEVESLDRENWNVPKFRMRIINRTDAKGDAVVFLKAGEHPVGASWNAGTGECIALTLSTIAGWADSLPAQKSVAQVIGNAVRRLVAGREAPLRVRTFPGKEGVGVEVTWGHGTPPETLGSVRARFRHRLTNRYGEVVLRRTGINRFEGELPDWGSGTYVMYVPELKARGTATRIYGEELRALGIDGASLARPEAGDRWSVVGDFRDLSSRLDRAAVVTKPLRPWFLGIALLLFLGQLFWGVFTGR